MAQPKSYVNNASESAPLLKYDAGRSGELGNSRSKAYSLRCRQAVAHSVLAGRRQERGHGSLECWVSSCCRSSSAAFARRCLGATEGQCLRYVHVWKECSLKLRERNAMRVILIAVPLPAIFEQLAYMYVRDDEKGRLPRRAFQGFIHVQTSAFCKS